MGTHWALAETGGREVQGSSLLLYEKSCQAQVGEERRTFCCIIHPITGTALSSVLTNG